jgi:hypothetical protein
MATSHLSDDELLASIVSDGSGDMYEYFTDYPLVLTLTNLTSWMQQWMWDAVLTKLYIEHLDKFTIDPNEYEQIHSMLLKRSNRDNEGVIDTMAVSSDTQ